MDRIRFLIKTVHNKKNLSKSANVRHYEMVVKPVVWHGEEIIGFSSTKRLDNRQKDTEMNIWAKENGRGVFLLPPPIKKKKELYDWSTVDVIEEKKVEISRQDEKYE